MKNKTITILLAAVIFQSAMADPIRKCVINGNIVYSDNVCNEQSVGIDTINATPPTQADKHAAEMRSAKAKKEEELKAVEKARIKSRDAGCDYPARNVAAMYDRAKRFPNNSSLLKQAIAAEERLKRQCPNHFIVNRD